ncbi:MAG: DNRLRE domain-containing protein, partial [Anaerolineae bacterium]|nr:DNRLRE domain-containing protein [Anaerolineae bacterium]
PSQADLTDWDAVTLYLDINGNSGAVPTSSSYRFINQFGSDTGSSTGQAAYRGNGADWVAAATSFTAGSGWRGDGFNGGQEARGWVAEFHIPFTSLGLSGPPPESTVWGLGLTLHDRDEASGTAIPTQSWPETLNGQQPVTWGELAFGQPSYSPPPAEPGQLVTIRQGLNGATVPDGHVGGGTLCGQSFNPDFFNGWGEANYAAVDQINIQNQWDVADWPCFSKYYVTFPLDQLPPGKTIISATLTIHLFGNSEPSQAQPSYIQALTVGQAWDEATLTWNNAPLATENVAGTTVAPVINFPGWPGVPYRWDLSGAVATAYQTGQPLRLVLYSADGDYHSGKYFVSSETGDWNAVARPTLEVLWGDPSLKVTPAFKQINPGESTDYTIEIEAGSIFSGPVTLNAASPSSELTISFSPNPLSPPGQSTMTITSLHSGPLNPGLFFTIPVTATTVTATRSVEVTLLVGGSQLYLPLITKE